MLSPGYIFCLCLEFNFRIKIKVELRNTVVLFKTVINLDAKDDLECHFKLKTLTNEFIIVQSMYWISYT